MENGKRFIWPKLNESPIDDLRELQEEHERIKNINSIRYLKNAAKDEKRMRDIKQYLVDYHKKQGKNYS